MRAHGASSALTRVAAPALLRRNASAVAAARDVADLPTALFGNYPLRASAVKEAVDGMSALELHDAIIRRVRDCPPASLDSAATPSVLMRSHAPCATTVRRRHHLLPRGLRS